MAIRHLIAAGGLAAICSTANVAAEPARPYGSQLAVGNSGDESVRRYRYGAAR